jgi:outer membrane protein OmpA-like peptidoglycan-associated protein
MRKWHLDLARHSQLRGQSGSRLKTLPQFPFNPFGHHSEASILKPSGRVATKIYVNVRWQNLRLEVKVFPLKPNTGVMRVRLRSFCLLKPWLLLLGCLGSIGQVQALGDIAFQSGIHESKWETHSSSRICSLSHPIPDYGTATFELKPGRKVKFRLEVLDPHSEPGEAILDALAPAWMHHQVMIEQQQVKLRTGSSPFVVSSMQGEQLLDTLALGLLNRFSYTQSRAKRDRQVSVTLSPVRFQKAYREFQTCIEGLPSYSYGDVRSKRLLYDSGRHELTNASRQELDELVIFLHASEGQYRVIIKGHTDSVDHRGYNKKLSSRRAGKVLDYLVSQGVDPKLLEKRFYGESRPQESNRSEEGRRKNRRVELEVVPVESGQVAISK